MGGGGTGTNADGIVKAAQGVETCCVSIPLRYMHTPIETIAVEDVDNTANLIAAYAKKNRQIMILRQEEEKWN